MVDQWQQAGGMRRPHRDRSSPLDITLAASDSRCTRAETRHAGTGVGRKFTVLEQNVWASQSLVNFFVRGSR